jgi:D-lactate dehydrogenase (cytochrome)
VVLADGRVIHTGSRARKSAAGYDLTRLFVGSEGTLGIITEVTLRLYGIPEAVSAAVCPFASLDAAVETVIETIQTGVPVARIELLDEAQIAAINKYSKLDNRVAPTLFFEFHGTAAGVAEQVEIVKSIAAEHGANDFRWADTPEERSKLWQARHDAYYAALALRPGSKGWATDVCVPISRLAECIGETKRDLALSPIPSALVGHVGDGNFHLVFMIDPQRPEEIAEASRLNDRMVARALAMEGTSTGEHGVGYGKMGFMPAEHGEALAVMGVIKMALDPQNILNPGKIVRI